MNTSYNAETVRLLEKEYFGTMINIISDGNQLRLFKRFLRSLKRIGIEDYELPEAITLGIENGNLREKLVNSIIKIEKGTGMDRSRKLEFIRGLIAARNYESSMSLHPINQETSSESSDTYYVDKELDKLRKILCDPEIGEKADLIDFADVVLKCYDKYKYSTNERVKGFWVTNTRKIAEQICEQTSGNIAAVTDDCTLNTVCSMISDAVENCIISVPEIDWIMMSETVKSVFDSWHDINYLCFYCDSPYAKLLKIGNYLRINYDDGSETEDDDSSGSIWSLDRFENNNRIIYQIVSRPERYENIDEMIAVRKNPREGYPGRTIMVENWINSYDVHSMDKNEAGLYAVNVKRVHFSDNI